MSARPSGYQKFKDEEVVFQAGKQQAPLDVSAGIQQGNADFPIDQIPPNFEWAEIHRQAWNVGTTTLSKRQQRRLQKQKQKTVQNDPHNHVGEVCQCCAREVPNHIVSVSCNNKDLSFLGAGMPLYFEYIKSCILMLLIMFVTSGDYNIVTNIAFGSSCNTIDSQAGKEIDEKEFCTLNWVTQMSLANKRNGSQFIQLQQMLNLISMVTLIVLFQYFRKEQRSFDAEIDSQTQYASDFTIHVKNIPTDTQGLKNGDFDEDLQDFFEQHIKAFEKPEEVIDYEQDLKQFQIQNKQAQKELRRVVSVNLCYDLSSQDAYEKQKSVKIQEKQKVLSKLYGEGKQPDSVDVNNDPQIKTINSEIQQIEDQLEKLEARFIEGKQVQEFFLGQAFVTFQWESDVQALLDKYQLSSFQRLIGKKSQLTYRGQQILIAEPPEPTDVFWQNLHIKTGSKIFRRIVGLMVTGIILTTCSYLIYWLSSVQAQSADEQAQAIKRGDLSPNYEVKAIAQLASLAIIIINAILAMIIKSVSTFEKFSTQTGFNISLASKSSMAQFINTAVITFAISTWVTKNIYGTGGLVYNQTYVFLTNAVLPGIIALVDAGTVQKWLFQWLEKKKLSKSIKTQKELHDLFERPTFDIASSYSIVLKNMYIVAFYASVIPLGLVITCFFLLFHYWVEKYNIARRRTIKFNYSSKMSTEMIEQLELVLPIYCATNLWWEYAFLQDVSTMAIIGITLGIANAILPMAEINEKLFPMKAEADEYIPIREAESGFLTDYCRENPATAEEARKSYAQRIKKHKEQKDKMDQMYGD